MSVHYIENYLLNPTHPLTINVIGVGGNGSAVIGSLTRLHLGLQALGHPGIHVRAYDGDQVSVANIGRQGFSPSDVGENKASLLISRINRYYGLNWQGFPVFYDKKLVGNSDEHSSNIIITCVDTAKARIEIGKLLSSKTSYSPYRKAYYWMDFGNAKTTGQVILGTLCAIKQPEESKGAERLPTVLEMFSDLDKQDEASSHIPSCSLAQALQSQDLFINPTLVNLGMALLWKLLREVKISVQGAYLNLDTLKSNPIPIKS